MQQSNNTCVPEALLSGAHDIFLSHSGAQKGFAKDLYRVLTSHGFPTFLDVTYHSLPPAQSFPHRIFTAASSCKLALVVLSNEYVSSKWPMLELSAFVHAMPSVKILPLFFHLSVSDLKNQDNLRKWRRVWKSFAKLDPHRIHVSEWEKSLLLLCSHNGLAYNAALEGEFAYIERIVSSICTSRTLTPRNKYDTSYMQGEARLHEIIFNKFEEMESNCKPRQLASQHNCFAGPSSSSSPQSRIACVLGIYGLPGSGKSTLGRSLRDYFFPIYAGKSFYLEVPNNPSPADLVHIFRDVLNLAALHPQSEVTHIDQVVSLLKNNQISRNPLFIVVDNICDQSSEAVHRILRNVIGPGSRVLLVARTFNVLRPTLGALMSNSLQKLDIDDIQLICSCDSMPMPSINEMEATNILLHTLRQAIALPPAVDRRQKKKASRIVRMCGFGPRDCDLVYLPLVVKTMGAMLIRYQKDADGRTYCDQKKFWNSFDNKVLHAFRESVVGMLISKSFKNLVNEQLQFLFLDHSRLHGSGLHEVLSIVSFMRRKSRRKFREYARNLMNRDLLCADSADPFFDECGEYILRMEEKMIQNIIKMKNNIERQCLISYTGAELLATIHTVQTLIALIDSCKKPERVDLSVEFQPLMHIRIRGHDDAFIDVEVDQALPGLPNIQQVHSSVEEYSDQLSVLSSIHDVLRLLVRKCLKEACYSMLQQNCNFSYWTGLKRLQDKAMLTRTLDTESTAAGIKKLRNSRDSEIRDGSINGRINLANFGSRTSMCLPMRNVVKAWSCYHSRAFMRSGAPIYFSVCLPTSVAAVTLY